MSSFTTPLRIEALGGDNPTYKLLEPFDYWTELIKNYSGDYYTISVPEGFVTNFASIPKLFHWILSPDGRHGKASVIHDYAYLVVKKNFERDLMNAQSWTDIMIADCFMRDSKKIADKIFSEAMDVLKVKKWINWVMYTAVDEFGFYSIIGD